MKITRLKKGYVIRVTDAEMAVLEETVSEGMGSSLWDDVEEGYSHMPPAQRRIITEVNTCKRDWMVVTDNRRA
tara:strand:- start:346 stop:564 length:219 start_codon:yes stop_codon:yes gene_type:complete